MTKRPSLGRHKLSKRGKVIINRQPLHMQVADSLRQMIVSGRLAANEKVPVNDLADELGVSLTPLREALKVLAGEQLIDLTPNRGARVAPVTITETQHLFELMAGLESLAAELAAQRMTPAQLDTLQQVHDEMCACCEAGDNAGYFDCNRRIHDLVVEYAANPILAYSRAQLSVRAMRVRFLSVTLGAGREKSLGDHKSLMEAFHARDAEAAHRIWRRHLLRSGEECCAILRQEFSQAESAGAAAPAKGQGAPLGD